MDEREAELVAQLGCFNVPQKIRQLLDSAIELSLARTSDKKSFLLALFEKVEGLTASDLIKGYIQYRLAREYAKLQ